MQHENQRETLSGFNCGPGPPEVRAGGRPAFPRSRPRLELRQAFAEQFCSARGYLADAGNLSLFPDALAWAVRLPAHILGHCRALVLNHLLSHCMLLSLAAEVADCDGWGCEKHHAPAASSAAMA